MKLEITSQILSTALAICLRSFLVVRKLRPAGRAGFIVLLCAEANELCSGHSLTKMCRKQALIKILVVTMICCGVFPVWGAEQNFRALAEKEALGDVKSEAKNTNRAATVQAVAEGKKAKKTKRVWSIKGFVQRHQNRGEVNVKGVGSYNLSRLSQPLFFGLELDFKPALAVGDIAPSLFVRSAYSLVATHLKAPNGFQFKKTHVHSFLHTIGVAGHINVSKTRPWDTRMQLGVGRGDVFHAGDNELTNVHMASYWLVLGGELEWWLNPHWAVGLGYVFREPLRKQPSVRPQTHGLMLGLRGIVW